MGRPGWTPQTLRIGKQHCLLDLFGLQLIVFDARSQGLKRVAILRLDVPAHPAQGTNNAVVPGSNNARCGLDIAAA